MRKKLRITMVTVLTFCMLLLMGVTVQAASKPSANDFSISYYDSSLTTIGVKFSSYSSMKEVALCNSSGKIVDTQQCAMYATFSNLKKNRVYACKYRTIAYSSAKKGYVATSAWSTTKSFCTAKYKLALSTNASKTVKLTVPKISGIKKYILYMSTSSTSGFKKVASVKAGNTLKVSKFNKKALVYNKNYYYKLVPVRQNGSKLTAIEGYFYLYQTYSR